MNSIGLVLGGGAAKAFSHIGFYKVLYDNEINISAISGTSMGAVIGAMIARRASPDQILEVGKAFTKECQNNWSWKHIQVKDGGILNEKLEMKALHSLIPEGMKFEDLEIPFATNALDIETGNEVELKEGDLNSALLASSALPGVYAPVFREDKLLVDGGVINNIPVKLCRNMTQDKVVAIDLKSHYSEQNLSGLIYHFYIQKKLEKIHHLKVSHNRMKELLLKLEFPLSVLMRSMSITEDRLNEINLKNYPPDFLIHPRVEQYGLFDYKQCDVLVQAGVDAAEALLPTLKKLKRSKKTIRRNSGTVRTVPESGAQGGTHELF